MAKKVEFALRTYLTEGNCSNTRGGKCGQTVKIGIVRPGL